MAAATLCGSPGTCSISSSEALFSASTVLKCLSTALRRAGPTPGTPSSRDATDALPRRLRWWVIAKRCASSRRRWIRCSALEWRSSTMDMSLYGSTISSMRLARPNIGMFSPSACMASCAAESWPRPPSMRIRSGRSENFPPRGSSPCACRSASSFKPWVSRRVMTSCMEAKSFAPSTVLMR